MTIIFRIESVQFSNSPVVGTVVGVAAAGVGEVAEGVAERLVAGVVAERLVAGVAAERLVAEGVRVEKVGVGVGQDVMLHCFTCVSLPLHERSSFTTLYHVLFLD